MILHERLDVLTVEDFDFIIPQLGCVCHLSLHSSLVWLLKTVAPVHILTHIGPVQLVFQTVVIKGALIRPPLSDGLQLSVPDLTWKEADVLVLQWSVLTSFFMLEAPS